MAYPILYESIVPGTVPADFGLGVLAPISCTVEETRNGTYDLEMVYPANGIHASEIATRRILKVKPNFTDDPQLFRIYKVGKVLGGQFTVLAHHISYDLNDLTIISGTASNAVAACQLLQNAAPGYTFSTDKTNSGSFKITEPSSVRSWLAGKTGSLLDVYGTGEYYFDNFNVQLKLHRGVTTPRTTVRYGKNLMELSQELSSENLATSVQAYYKGSDDAVVVGNEISTGLTLDVPVKRIIDCSSDFQEPPTVAELDAVVTAYINGHELTVPTNNIKLDFAQIGQLKDRVDLCDMVNIYYEAYGITVSAKCIRTKWDCIEERYIETEFGSDVSSFVDNIVSNNKKLAETPTTTFMESAIAHATDQITGNLGGYVVLHDSNGDGEPDEILIMDQPTISSSTKIWRWNKSGLGYSSTGYSGSYSTAITADGEIVADFIKTGALNASLITTGVLNADLIKAGTIQDTGNNSSINLSTGEAILKNIKAKLALILVDANGVERGQMKYTIQTGAAIFLREPNNQATVAITAGTSNDASMSLLRSNGTSGVDIEIDNSEGGRAFFANSSNKYGVTIKADTGYGGSVAVNNDNGNKRGELYNTANGGCLDLYNSLGNVAIEAYTYHDDGFVYIKDSESHNTIILNGDLGYITCVHLQETSSRKVKKNIKPIEDSEKILELEAVSFDYQRERWGTDQRGFIAEDVAKVLPNLVTEETEDQYASLNYIGMIPYLQDVIKKQEQRIKALEEKISQLSK